MKITMTVISERQCVHFCIYKNQKQLCNVFIYKQPGSFQKARQLPLGFINNNQNTLHYTIFHETFEVGIYI